MNTRRFNRRGKAINLRVYNTLVIIGVIIGIVTATILGVYAQDLSYYLNDRYETIGLETAITCTTFLSVGLYIVTPVILYKFLKLNRTFAIAGIFICVLIGFPITLFSYFVWAMWM